MSKPTSGVRSEIYWDGPCAWPCCKDTLGRFKTREARDEAAERRGWQLTAKGERLCVRHGRYDQ